MLHTKSNRSRLLKVLAFLPIIAVALAVNAEKVTEVKYINTSSGSLLGTIELKTDMPKVSTELTAELPALTELTGKHAIYLKFSSATKEKSLCTLETLVFK